MDVKYYTMGEVLNYFSVQDVGCDVLEALWTPEITVSCPEVIEMRVAPIYHTGVLEGHACYSEKLDTLYLFNCEPMSRFRERMIRYELSSS